MSNFIHLHNHSEFSIFDGHGTIEDYVALASADGQDAFALTDHGTIGGSIQLYKAAKKAGIKPIIGCELYVDPGEYQDSDFPAHLTVLAANEDGYRDLIKANTLASEHFYYRPRITLRDLIDNELMRNWIVLSGCMSGVVLKTMDEDYNRAISLIEALDRNALEFYLELMWHESTDQDFATRQLTAIDNLVEIANNKGLPVVLTNDCHYSTQEGEEAHQDFLKSAEDKVKGIEFDGSGFHLKTQEQMCWLAEQLDISDAAENTVWIANRIETHISEVDNLHWYVPDITGGKPEETIRDICETYLPEPVEYRNQLEHEMSVLQKSPAIMNSYLVAYDIINWCAEQGIPAAARGSMAGSLVSWLLGITLEDPVYYNLLFERAVNPARPTIPDFDIDVSSGRRGEVLEYLDDKYLESKPISAYAAYGPRGAIGHVLRVKGVDFQLARSLSSACPEEWPDAKAYIHEHLLQDEPAILAFEGFYANMTIHPAGVLLGGPERSLAHEVPMCSLSKGGGSERILASQYDMYSLKSMGLFKLDILGLSTLDHLAKMEQLSGVKAPMVYDDENVFTAFDAGAVSEIFQMDGYACREAIKQVGVHNFEDIVAINSLVRPGASQFLSHYRTGDQSLIREYPPIEPILGYTNGLIIYQEQVMQITAVLADFDDAEQDDIKEAIKYFRRETFEKELGPKFRQRCAAKGYDPEHMVETIIKFAGYAFNRAHAVSYSGIAYRMMWYKVNHPEAFYAAVFDSCPSRERLILESYLFNCRWRLADINDSQTDTTVIDGEIVIGLGAIKGIGPATCETIEEARMIEGEFTSTEHFVASVDRRRCNKQKQQILADVGAFPWEIGIRSKQEDAYGFNIDILDQQIANEVAVKENHKLGGFITGLREVNTSRGSMGIMTVMSSMGEYEAVAYNDVWPKVKRAVASRPAVIFHGTWGMYKGKSNFVVTGGEIVE